MEFLTFSRMLSIVGLFLCATLGSFAQDYEKIIVYFNPASNTNITTSTAISKVGFSTPMVFSKISKVTKIFATKSSTGIYIGTTTVAGTIQFDVLPAYRTGVRKILVNAIQYYDNDTPLEATLSVNDSEPRQIVSANSQEENTYEFTNNPDVALTNVKLSTTARIIALTLTLVYKDEGSAGIDTIGMDGDDFSSDSEIYTLEGIRISHENLNPGIYIIRRGSTTKKIIVR